MDRTATLVQIAGLIEIGGRKNGTVRSVGDPEWAVRGVWWAGRDNAPPAVPAWLVLPALLPSVRGSAGFRGGHTIGSGGADSGR